MSLKTHVFLDKFMGLQDDVVVLAAGTFINSLLKVADENWNPN